MRRFLCITITVTAALLAVSGAVGTVGAQTNEPARAQNPEHKRSESHVVIDGQKFSLHTVSRGETLYSLADIYGVGVSDIIGANPLVAEGLKMGMTIKIPDFAPAAPLFVEHTVKAKETAYSITRSYGISLATLVEDNPDIEPTQLSIGTVLRIRNGSANGGGGGEGSGGVGGVSDGGASTRHAEVRHTEMQRTDIQNSADTAPEAFAAVSAAYPVDSLPRIYFRPVTGTPNIALMLPLETVPVPADFIDFYRGALIAMEVQKSEGRSLNVTLYNTARSTDKVLDLVSSPDFSATNLIIGPVYESEMAPALQFADVYGVPVVSPLTNAEKLDSPMLYVMSPDPNTKYNKLRPMFGVGKNVILVSSATGNDREFEHEITEVFRAEETDHAKFTIGEAGDISTLIDWNRENVVVVLAATELAADRALATISSSYNNASARRGRRADISVVGSSKWASYSTIDKNLYFKLGVCFITSYYIENSGAAAPFQARYLEAYGEFPSRAAFRGYDAVALFSDAIFEKNGGRFGEKLSTEAETPLRTPYRFVQSGGHSRHTNVEWSLVRFKSDFNRTIE
jgi:LysM repeat protein/ABC-type branched-subunit amino acid transport system substrate-binding protein